jgi:hypothetical protein
MSCFETKKFRPNFNVGCSDAQMLALSLYSYFTEGRVPYVSFGTKTGVKVHRNKKKCARQMFSINAAVVNLAH